MEDETGRREVNKMRLAHRLIHDGNLSAALVLASSLALGLALGFALPTDDSLPGTLPSLACLALTSARPTLSCS
jgi:hypothetical protein